MSTGNPKWVKGAASPNPNGRPKIPTELLKYKGLCPDTIRRQFHRYSEMSRSELEVLKDDKSLTGLEWNIVMALLNPDKFPFFLDRTVGKVADRVESVNINIDADSEEYREIPREALVKLVSGDE